MNSKPKFELFHQVNLRRELFLIERQCGVISHFFPVGQFILSFLPKSMLSRNELVHYKSYSPDIDWLSISLLPKHLFRCLVYQCATCVIQITLDVKLNGKTKVNDFCRFKIINVVKDNICRLQIPVHIISIVNMLQAFQDPFHNQCTLILTQWL